MTAKLIDSRQRKNDVLSIVIEQYTRSVAPVGSSFIAQVLPYDVSSATIRNILSELEEDGYLTHPHTSAGRLPTQKGYRFYVDFLMQEIKMLEEEKNKIRQKYQEETKELDRLLERTSQVISDITHYTSIISVDDGGSKIICNGRSFIVEYPDYYQDFSCIKKILYALDEKQRLLEVINRDLARKIQFFIGSETACNDISNCSLAITEYKTHHGPRGRIALLGPTCMNYKKVTSALDYFSKLMEDLF